MFSSWTTLNAQFDNKVDALEVGFSGELWVCGAFESVDGGIWASKLAVRYPKRWIPLAGNVSLSDQTNVVVANGSDIYFGGFMDTVSSPSSLTVSRIGRWNLDTQRFYPLLQGLLGTNPNVVDIVVNGTEILVGGKFDAAKGSGVVLNSIAGFDGVNWYSFGSVGNTDGVVNAIAVNGSILYAGIFAQKETKKIIYSHFFFFFFFFMFSQVARLP